MIGWLKAHKWVSYLLVVIVVGAIIGSIFSAGVEHGEQVVQAEWNEAKLEQQAEQIANQKRVRKLELNHANTLTRLIDQYTQEVSNVQANRDQLLDSNQQLRERFQRRPACEPVSETEGSVERIDGAGESGLLKEDEEFLIRFAAECDEVAVKANKTQEALKVCEDTMRNSE